MKFQKFQLTEFDWSSSMNYSNQSFNFKVQNVQFYQSNKQQLTFVCSRTCSNSKIFAFIRGCITFKFNLEFRFLSMPKFHNRKFQNSTRNLDIRLIENGTHSDLSRICFKPKSDVLFCQIFEKKSDIKFCNF